MASTLLVLLASVLSSEACTAPTIIASSSPPIRDSVRSHKGNKLILNTSRKPVTLLCSGENSENLSICSKKNCLELERVNSTTVKHVIPTPSLQPSMYTCSYKSCEDYVTVIIRPSISVVSEVIHFTTDSHNLRIYFVPYGENYEVFCSCYEGAPLYIDSSFYRPYRKAISKNETTVKLSARAERIGITSFWCFLNGSAMADSATVVADLPVEAQEFQCMSHGERQIICTWRSQTRMNFYKLFLVSVHKQSYIASRILCSDAPGVTTRTCSWDNVVAYDEQDMEMKGGDFTLLLQSCNDVYCTNQTFVLNLRSITKLDPPSEVKLLNTSARDASITWHLPGRFQESVSQFEFKVEYRLLGSDWRQINSSSVQCTFYSRFYEIHCEFRLLLPCPDVHYEVRLYVKLQVAKGEKYWSDPVSLFFYTEPAEDRGGQECDSKFSESEPPPSATVVLFKIRRLISYERKAKLELKEKLKALKTKRDRVKALIESLARLE